MPIERYERSYAATRLSGRRVIRGIWILVVDENRRAGPRVVAADDFPATPLDGGCGIITVVYDVAADSIIQATCSGYA